MTEDNLIGDRKMSVDLNFVLLWVNFCFWRKSSCRALGNTLRTAGWTPLG